MTTPKTELIEKQINKWGDKILTDLQNEIKQGHWMWWGFPQEDGSWGINEVSNNTKKYALNEIDAESLIRSSKVFKTYYIVALEILLGKIEGRTQSIQQSILYKYFGEVDYLKFNSHINLFYKVSKTFSSKNSDNIKTIKELLDIFAVILDIQSIPDINNNTHSRRHTARMPTMPKNNGSRNLTRHFTRASTLTKLNSANNGPKIPNTRTRTAMGFQVLPPIGRTRTNTAAPKHSNSNIVSPFEKGNNPVAAYIYTRDDKGTFYFGFVRKLYNGGRTRLDNRKDTNYGAAGTKPKFMGKWTSIGGNRNAEQSHLVAVIAELNDETNSNFYSKNVDLTNIKPTYKKPATIDLILKTIIYDTKTNSIVFIFEMPKATFFNVFPKGGKTEPKLLTSSHGEIDATQSYSMEDIMSISHRESNYFIYYCANNFNNYVIPYISTISKGFRDNWFGQQIIGFDDNKERMPIELPHKPYKEISDRDYGI